MNTKIESTNKIKTRQDFVTFINDLLIDYKTNKGDWENKDLESFLKALSACTKDIDSFYKNTHQNINTENASWKTFADMFMSARIYE